MSLIRNLNGGITYRWLIYWRLTHYTSVDDVQVNYYRKGINSWGPIKRRNNLTVRSTSEAPGAFESSKFRRRLSEFDRISPYHILKIWSNN